MRKDIEWLKNEMRIRGRFPAENEYVVEQYRQIMELIDQLDEPQKPVIPQFVANFIRETKPNNSLRLAFEYIAQQKIDNYDDELALWVEEGNSELFARAWIDGYEVEREKVYHVVNKKNYFMLRKYDGLVDIFHVSPSMSRDEYGKDTRFMLTEKEIKDYDERFWAFAEEVEE